MEPPFSALSAPPLRMQTRLTQQGIDRLKYYFYGLNVKVPTNVQLEEILTEIRMLPGCETYSHRNLRQWFYKHRRTPNPCHASERQPGPIKPQLNLDSIPAACVRQRDPRKFSVQILQNHSEVANQHPEEPVQPSTFSENQGMGVERSWDGSTSGGCIPRSLALEKTDTEVLQKNGASTAVPSDLEIPRLRLAK